MNKRCKNSDQQQGWSTSKNVGEGQHLRCLSTEFKKRNVALNKVYSTRTNKKQLRVEGKKIPKFLKRSTP